MALKQSGKINKLTINQDMLGGIGYFSQGVSAERGSSYWNSSRLLDNISIYGYSKHLVARKSSRTHQRTSGMLSHRMTAVADFVWSTNPLRALGMGESLEKLWRLGEDFLSECHCQSLILPFWLNFFIALLIWKSYLFACLFVHQWNPSLSIAESDLLLPPAPLLCS